MKNRLRQITIYEKVKPNWKDNTEQAKEFWSESILDKIARIRTLHFTWKFPFIKIVDFTGNIKDMQNAINQQMNIILDNKTKINSKLKLYEKQS